MTAPRKESRANWAADLARQAGMRRPQPWKKRGPDRFASFADASRFVMVAGPQEESHVDLAPGLRADLGRGRAWCSSFPRTTRSRHCSAPWLKRGRPDLLTPAVRRATV